MGKRSPVSLRFVISMRRGLSISTKRGQVCQRGRRGGSEKLEIRASRWKATTRIPRQRRGKKHLSAARKSLVRLVRSYKCARKPHSLARNSNNRLIIVNVYHAADPKLSSIRITLSADVIAGVLLRSGLRSNLVPCEVHLAGQEKRAFAASLTGHVHLGRENFPSSNVMS